MVIVNPEEMPSHTAATGRLLLSSMRSTGIRAVRQLNTTPADGGRREAPAMETRCVGVAWIIGTSVGPPEKRIDQSPRAWARTARCTRERGVCGVPGEAGRSGR
jgi:hypothetical protein